MVNFVLSASIEKLRQENEVFQLGSDELKAKLLGSQDRKKEVLASLDAVNQKLANLLGTKLDIENEVVLRSFKRHATPLHPALTYQLQTLSPTEVYRERDTHQQSHARYDQLLPFMVSRQEFQEKLSCLHLTPEDSSATKVPIEVECVSLSRHPQCSGSIRCATRQRSRSRHFVTAQLMRANSAPDMWILLA